MHLVEARATTRHRYRNYLTWLAGLAAALVEPTICDQ
jgi:hypothetical protein